MATRGVTARHADPLQFRQLLGRFPTGVTVITTRDREGRPAGMTASALSAVSLSPPILLVCVDLAAEFHPVLREAPAFAVNVLGHDQEHLSRRFAASGIDRFAGVPYDIGPEDLPLLSGVVAHVFCARWDVQDVGDHAIFFGLVLGGATFDRIPLVHHRGTYTITGDTP